MDLHSLMREFLKIEGAHVGKGYLHPDDPQPQLQEINEYFINKYSFVQRDQGYLDFLRRYAGAYILQPPTDEEVPDYTWWVDIFGFFFEDMWFAFEDETSINDHLNSDGYLMFSQSLFNDRVSRPELIGVMYYVGIEMDGVYQRVCYKHDLSENVPYQWYCEDFLTWLDRFIENEGITF